MQQESNSASVAKWSMNKSKTGCHATCLQCGKVNELSDGHKSCLMKVKVH